MTKALAQTAKQIAVAVAAKPSAAAKQKPVAKAAPAAPKAKASPITHALVTGRPTSGARLFAFTAAWMGLTGFDKGLPVDKAHVQAVAGNTAVAHHIGEGRFAMKEGKLVLTAGGREHFAKRKDAIDPQVVRAFQTVMTTGRPDGAEVKNKDCIRAL